MATFGTTAWATSAFAGDNNQTSPAGSAVATVTEMVTGPAVTLGYTYTPPTGVTPTNFWVRWVLITPDGTDTLYDTGWTEITYAATGTEVINIVELGLPTDTGTGSANPTLHYDAQLWVSPASSPTAGNYSVVSTGSFDIQWGIATLVWQLAPPSQVTSGSLNVGWALTSTRGATQGSWEVTLTDPSGSVGYYDSGLQTTDISSFTIPYELSNDVSYRVGVRVTNSNGIPATPLSALFVSAQPVAKPPITGGPLQRFLSLIGFQLDIDRSYLEQLRNLPNPRLCPGNFLPYLAQQLGVAYEDSLGMDRTRKILQNIVYLYKNKGTTEGITGIATAVTGWAATLGVGPNLFLGSTHTFGPEAWIGSEQAGIATMGGTGQSTAPTGYTGTATPASWPAGLPTGLYVPAIGFWRANEQSLPGPEVETRSEVSEGLSGTTEAQSSAAANVTDQVTASFSSLMGFPPSQGGIPIQGLTGDLSASVWLNAQGFTAYPSATIAINQYDQFGTLLNHSVSVATQLAAGTWSHLTIAGVAIAAGAVWAEVLIATTANTWLPAESALLTMAAPMLVNAATVPAWTPPRELLLNLAADRTNLVTNPSFEDDVTTGWTDNANATLAVTTTAAYLPADGVAANATHSLQITATAAGNPSIISTAMTINPVELYTASCYVQAATIARAARLEIRVFNSAGTLLTTIAGATVNEVVGEWVRLSAIVPPTQPLPATAANICLVVEWVGAAASEVHYMDAALMETGWALQPYFDGAVYGSSDYFYAAGEIADTSGPSYYYKNYVNKLVRLYSVLNGNTDPDAGYVSPLSITGFIPLGSTCALVTPLETYT